MDWRITRKPSLLALSGPSSIRPVAESQSLLPAMAAVIGARKVS